MAEFMLVLHDDPEAFKDMSPMEMQKVVEEYRSWAERLGAAGKLSGGRKLTDEPGRVLRRQGDRVLVKDGPFSESKEILGGYFLMTAESYDDKWEYVRLNPVRHGLVVRPGDWPYQGELNVLTVVNGSAGASPSRS